MRWILRILLVLILGGIVAGAAAWYKDRSDKPTVNFRTGKISRADILAAIGATGTVEPEEVIDVGAQVAGQILSFGKDADGKPVDYGSHIKQGMILAQIDDVVYQSELLSSKAQLAQANASVARANADILQAQAKLVQAQRDWERAEKLGPSDALSQAQYDSFKAAFETAKANVTVAQAGLAESQASVEQAGASVSRAERNLGYTVIKSPVEGVIIDRRVNIGQTVVASLNAPSLFLIAKDLRRMQVWVAVNEADIGHVHPTQPVTFTCDAFPGETFHGQVGKVRLNATMTQNVVTYTVEVITENPDGKLLPYLTANVAFETGRRENVVVVPNAALRYQPRPEVVQAAMTTDGASGAPAASQPADANAGGGRRGGRGNRGSTTRTGNSGDAPTRGTVYVVQPGNMLSALSVRLGITDGAVTEVLSDNLAEGMEVVTGEQREEIAASGGANPFTPQFRGGGRGGGGGGGRRGGGG